MTHPDQQTRAGFALLITVIVLGVVAAVGLAMVELTINQVRLATNAKDSEVAFHAANAGLECARYWRSNQSAAVESGDSTLTPSCFGGSLTDNTASDPELASGVSGDGSAYQYQWDFTWGSPERCSRVNLIAAVADSGGSGMTVNNMETLVPGYPDGTTKDCDAGGRCTVISVQGFNRACGNVGTFGTVQREVLVQF